MSLRLLLVFACVSAYMSTWSQTKKIAYKSHSGSMSVFYMESDDVPGFGMAPDYYVTNSSLDSVIYISDSSAVMVTSEYCPRRRTSSGEERLWRAGRDTVYHHELFTARHELNMIKSALSTQYNFKNPVDSIVFIGYDNQKQETDHHIKKHKVMIPAQGNDHHPPTGNITLIWISLTALISVASGLIAWRKKLYPTI